METKRPPNPTPGQRPGTPAIVPFVRTTLGCQCPDEVFRSVVIDRVEEAGDDPRHVRLTVGDRLLIYVYEPGETGAAAGAVEFLARAGLDERYARGLNRFRLVIATVQPPEFPGDARAAFALVVGSDERAHLHLVQTRDLPPALRAR